MWMLANKFHERLPHYLGQHQALAGTPWGDVYPAHVLRHVQVNVYEYLQALQVGSGGAEAPELPNFQELLRDLQRGCFHTSSSWLPLPRSLTVSPSVDQPGGTVVTMNTRASAAASTTSRLTSATAAGGGRLGGNASGATTTQGTYVPNAARDAEIDALQLRPQMRDLLRAHPPPANDAGNEFCVLWWGRGGCYMNCGRASTHHPFASAAERARLLAHVRAHLVVSAPAATATST